jgi:hypothetical protein
MTHTLEPVIGRYHKYKNVKTSMGVSLAACIKTGVDNPGHPMIKTVRNMHPQYPRHDHQYSLARSPVPPQHYPQYPEHDFPSAR